MSYIMVYDTETTSIDKPFCYNIGYVIIDIINKVVVLKRDFVCEQVWHNNMLFTTAYYSDKRQDYVKAMRGRKCLMEKFGYICRQMAKDIKDYGIEQAYAFNSSFDERVFEFNCDWFKCINPFDNVAVYDIRGYFHNVLDNDYITWAEDNEKFTESGNYSSTAESVYQYISNDLDFIESHTALDDSEIESEILLYCLDKGCVLGTDYKAKRSIERVVPQEFVVKMNGTEVFKAPTTSAKLYKKKNLLLLKG